ncbi:MAG TPA: site-specific DNA-methyltransferase [Bacteroidaceae bacterium]|nr:site-specific DNA-methyltransferase [Bacteroidaceae bacterium]
MDRLKMQSLDVIGSNIKKIQQLFPNCVTERLGKDGNPELAIDFEKLQAELSNEIIGEGEERYQFTWPDKRAANRLANTPTTMTLRPCREESVNFDHTQNLYIEGDNLDVLKALRETYLGKVKMIYIDPPYNTGNDFVYNDVFAQSRGEFEETSGLFDEEGNQTIDPMQRNTESNGRFHTDWLNMIYPRLKVARDLLSDDGVIFISIDDNEVANLKKICNEIFGESNFVANIIWKHTQQSKNDELHFSRQYNHTLCYSKEKLRLKRFYFDRTDEDNKNYKNPDNDPKGLWRSGDVRSPNYRKTLCYNIIAPNGNIITSPENGWRWSKESFNEKIATGEIKFKDDYSGIIRKIYLSDQPGRTPENLWDDKRFGSTRQAASMIKDLFDGKQVFDTPKPIELIKNMLHLVSRGCDIILDFFSGSATTAHAVMQLNAEDGGNRKFIMVQLPEKIDEKSEAYKAGYKNICEIGKERIRRAGKKIKEDNKDKEGIEKLDIGFRVLKLDSSNMEDVYYTPQEFTMQSLFNENVKADRTGEDLLFQVMLDLGIELSAKIETQQIAGKTVYLVDDNYLVACFDRDVTEAAITEIAKLHPIYFVMRDASAANDNVIDNFEQLFEVYSKDTVRKIL